MTAQDALPANRRRRTLVLAAAAIAAVAIAAAAILASLLAPGRDADAAPTVAPAPTAPHEDAVERPVDWSPHRPSVHITPEKHWMNDPQKPFFLDGLWHYYYLYNEDYPEGNGTAWYHTTSPDLVHWTDRGVAIEKYANGLGDIWTGTAVVDEQGTAGFGAGAVIALVTQQVDGVQRQSLFFSQDGGFTFQSFDGNPVMENPGVADWRDPRVIWDDAAGRWVMALAEHDRIGFYTSPDLRQWTYASDFTTTGLGIIECPDLFPMAVDGDPDDVRWVLAAGANGAAEGMTTGTVYWVGDWDGERFTAEDGTHRWLDHGPDYYAAVTWDDPRLDEQDRLARRYGIGWMNNWAYAGRFPTQEWHGGSDSLIRQISLHSDGGQVRLRSEPASELSALEGDAQPIGDITLHEGEFVAPPVPASGAYRLRLEVHGERDSEVRIRVLTGDGTFATVGYDFRAGVAFVARDMDAVAHAMPDAYREVRTVEVDSASGAVRLDVIVDAGSIEVFAGDGEAALTMATFGTSGERAVRIEGARDAVTVTGATLTPLRVAPIERTPARE